MNVRTVDIHKDRQTLLDFHCVINYESASPLFRKTYTFERSREVWMKSRGPDQFLTALEASLKDSRTIAEIWEDSGAAIAYVWVKFTDWPEYNATVAEIQDIMVAPAYQRKGIASQIIRRGEKLARERGATVLRSGTGAENVASQALHVKMGFKLDRMEYEKEL